MSEWIEKGRDYIKYSDVMILTHWSVSISQHKLCLSLNTTVVSLNERNCSVKGSVFQLKKKKNLQGLSICDHCWGHLNGPELVFGGTKPKTFNTHDHTSLTDLWNPTYVYVKASRLDSKWAHQLQSWIKTNFLLLSTSREKLMMAHQKKD